METSSVKWVQLNRILYPFTPDKEADPIFETSYNSDVPKMMDSVQHNNFVVKKDYCHRPLEDEGNMVVSIAKLRNSISE
jgi:hypothetical protein